MKKIISRSGMSRVCLISFILLCGTIGNVLSQDHWNRYSTSVYYDTFEKGTIIINVEFYDYYSKAEEHSFFKSCEFEYSEDKDKFSHLMSIRTTKQMHKTRFGIILISKNPGEQIQYKSSSNPNNFVIWSNGIRNLMVDVQAWKCSNGKLKKSCMIFKWHTSESCKNVKFIRIRGKWRVSNFEKDDKVDEVYRVVDNTSNSNAIKNTPSVSESEISDNVNISKVADGIILTGAKPCENIKVYTTTGAEVKSVVTNDDVVNIKLPKNQIYIIKAGQARYKVALCVP